MTKQCKVCGYEFGHDWEIYGAVGDCLCADCYFDMISDEQGYEEMYGMAPHHHDTSITGGWIGSTILDPLSEKPDENGWYKVGDGWFWPDKEVDGAQGIWREYRNPEDKPTGPYCSGE